MGGNEMKPEVLSPTFKSVPLRTAQRNGRPPGTERFADLHFEGVPSVAGPLPGPISRELLEAQEELESNARSYPRGIPVAFEEGRGATMRDADGNSYIDFFAGAGVLNVGHGNPAVAAAATAQQERLVHALDFPTSAKLRLVRNLKRLLPGRLSRTARIHFGGPTGSDAVEAAIKLARIHTGRQAVVAFQGSYHGMTAEALAVTGDTGLGGPTSSPVHFLPYPYEYRSPFGINGKGCWKACIHLLETALADPASGVPKPAAVIVEPIQGEGGTIVPPRGFLREVRRITHEHGALLIVDEIQTGFGRTGTMFACEHDHVTPDVITLSKALGGIGYPVSCIAYDEQFDSWGKGDHIGTFRGHQVAMAAGATALEYMEEMDLATHAAELGELALGSLEEAAGELPAVGDVRGRGLMIGIELVTDRDSKRPWPELAAEVRRASAERGLIIEVGGHHGNVARFLPPLVISRSLLERGIEIFVESLRECEAELGQLRAATAAA
jgi:diaminobutyrate-2-oxoglutarate transaminase